MSDVGLDRLNRMSLPDALKALGSCCGSSSWCLKIASGRPYPSRSELLRFAELKFRSLTRKEWMETFAHHTPIGKTLVNDPSFSSEERRDLVESCRRYAKRFGHVFIIRTTGMKPPEILAQLSRRLRYDAHDELYVAGQQQTMITQEKLITFLEELGRDIELLPRQEKTFVPVAEKHDWAYLKARGRQAVSSQDLSKKSA